MPNILVTMPFGEELLAKIRAVSPELTVVQASPDHADYSQAEILYAFMPPADLARAPHLKWVQLHLAGVNMLYDHPIYAINIPLTTTSGVHAASVAEYAFTMLLALAHRVPRMLEWQAKGTWPPDEQRWPLFVPAEVRAATLGIIGYGSIGREVARIGKTFAMRVLASKRDLTRKFDDGYRLPGTGDPDGSLPDAWFETGRGHSRASERESAAGGHSASGTAQRGAEGGESAVGGGSAAGAGHPVDDPPGRSTGGGRFGRGAGSGMPSPLGSGDSPASPNPVGWAAVSPASPAGPQGVGPKGSAGGLRELLVQSDYVVLAVPLTSETEGLIGAEELRAMKPSVVFINVGRGATVDEAALIQALAEKRIAGAALDVFAREPNPADSPLYHLDNVILSPHVSGFIPSYDEKCTDLFVANLQRYLHGEPLLNLVDRARGY